MQFQRNVKPEKLFSVERAASQLLDVAHHARSGQFLAWDGEELPW